MDLRKILTIVSKPRFGPTVFGDLIAREVVGRGLGYVAGSGAFWAKTLEIGLERILQDGIEYVITLDYDSAFLFDPHILMLIEGLDSRDVYHAIAPVQIYREGATVLGIPKGFQAGDVIPADVWKGGRYVELDSAHFGLTIFRAEAFKRIPRPWLWSVPAPDGTWGDGSIDADIRFWQQFRAAGLRVALDTECRIGHQVETVVWPDRDWRILHQYAGQFIAEGPPPETLPR